MSDRQEADKVDTPVGTYNPDWAILKHETDTVYLVREMKGTKDFLTRVCGDYPIANSNTYRLASTSRAMSDATIAALANPGRARTVQRVPTTRYSA